MGVTDGVRRKLAATFHDAVADMARDVLAAAIEDAPPDPPPGEDPDPALSLKESGYLQRLPGRGVEIGFRTPYAAKQHENFRLEHPRGGVPKFLERHMTAAAAQMEGRIALQLRKVMAERTVIAAPRGAALPSSTSSPARPTGGEQVTDLVNSVFSQAGVR